MHTNEPQDFSHVYFGTTKTNIMHKTRITNSNIEELNKNLYFLCESTKIAVKVFNLIKPDYIQVSKYINGCSFLIQKENRLLEIIPVKSYEVLGVITKKGEYIDLLHPFLWETRKKFDDWFSKFE